MSAEISTRVPPLCQLTFFHACLCFSSVQLEDYSDAEAIFNRLCVMEWHRSVWDCVRGRIPFHWGLTSPVFRDNPMSGLQYTLSNGQQIWRHRLYLVVRSISTAVCFPAS